ncbi:MAG TPA: hypothetical protein VIL41_01100 [Coriobacteriia bacterium]
MDTTLTGRLTHFAPPWLRYMFTLSEAARTGDAWVVAAGDDIALWDTDAGAVLPIWPTQELAAEVAEGEAEAAPVGVGEIADRLLPFLIKSDASASLFPNFDDDMLVEPDAVSEDLADSIAEPVDIAAQLIEAPVTAIYDEWALLESPGVDDELPEGWAPSDAAPALSGDRYADALAAVSATGALWLLDDPAEEAIVGMVLEDRPALTLFATKAQAAEYGERIDAEVVPLPVGLDALVRGWLLVAYSGQWAVALSPDATDAVFVEPTRFALDVAEACAAE